MRALARRQRSVRVSPGNIDIAARSTRGDLMVRTSSKTDPRDSATGARQRGRLRRLNQHMKVLAGLLAIYGPPVLVLQLHRPPLAKAYLALGMWAIEAIIWHWLDTRLVNKTVASEQDRQRRLAVEEVKRRIEEEGLPSLGLTDLENSTLLRP